jgi:hypothetical protein
MLDKDTPSHQLACYDPGVGTLAADCGAFPASPHGLAAVHAHRRIRIEDNVAEASVGTISAAVRHRTDRSFLFEIERTTRNPLRRRRSHWMTTVSPALLAEVGSI